MPRILKHRLPPSNLEKKPKYVKRKAEKVKTFKKKDAMMKDSFKILEPSQA